MTRPLAVLPPTCIYAFGVAVPKYVYRPLEVIAAMFLGLIIAAAIILIVSPIALLAGAIAGVAYLILKYYFRRRPSRLEPQPHE